jgi:hypothetical protein
MRSSGVEGAYEIEMFKRSHHIYKLGLQLFDMTKSVEE